MSEFTQGICTDGAAILKDGVMLTVEEIIELLRQGDKLMGGGEPVAWMYFVNGVHVNFSSFEPPDDAYDAGTLVPLYDSPQATQSQQIGWVHRNRIGNPSTSLLSDRIYRASVEDPDDYVPVYLHEIVDAVKAAMKGEG